jgi:anti-sigma factor RsiW
MATTAFLPILSALDRLFLGHARGPGPGMQPCVTHVAFGTLVDYVRGLGSAAAREQVRKHLSACAHCQQTADGLTHLTEIAAADIDCEVPDEVVDEAIALFTSDAADRRALADVDRFFTDRSRSTLDDGTPHSRAKGQPRFLRFAPPGGEIDVHLLVIEETGVVVVSGQIVARKAGEPVDLEVSAHRGPDRDTIGRTRATPGGLFQLRYDAPAAAVLRFVNADDPAPVVVSIDDEA